MSDDQPDIGNSGFRKQLRNIGKGAKKRLKRLGNSFRSGSESPATTPSRSSTPQAVGSQPANPASNEPPVESISTSTRPGIDTSSSHPFMGAHAGSEPEPDVPIQRGAHIQPKGATPASLQHGFDEANIPSTPNEHSEEGTPSMNTPNQPTPSRYDKVKDQFGVAWSFTRLLLKKAPVAVDTNPVKIVFGIAQIAVELKKGMQDNMDATERRTAALLDLMVVVDEATRNWHSGGSHETRAMKAFEAALSKELDNFFAIQEQSKARQFFVQEEDKQHIAEIFERVNEARENMILATGLRVHKIVVAITQKLNKLLREQLKPSRIADHKCYLGDEEETLRRAVCTAGTRRRLLKELIAWANAVSDGYSIYWLFGPAGTGKSTIARTIARRFEFACIPEDTIVLGANFFCSRQFEETNTVAQIVPTIVYQLALVCKAFADAYDQHGDDSAIQQNPAAQLQGLLVEPWKQSEAARIANKDPTYLVGIDALDELKSKGGSVFLRALLNVQSDLTGLKFFVTSREDPNIVAYSKDLDNGQVCYLREVPQEEADADLKTYLVDELGDIASKEEIQRLVTDAAGLFIFARTVVEYVGVASRPAEEQRDLLDRLLNASPSTAATGPRLTATLDALYLQILREALNPEDPQRHLFQKRLLVLHTFLCTVERTSTLVVTHLLNNQSNNNPLTTMANTTHAMRHVSVVDDVLGRLHAVLYSQGGLVMSFHKSFPDFVFDRERSKEFYCDQESHHRHLAEGCFKIMRQQLHFNIADISDSSIFDRDNKMLQDSVKHHISPTLSYACRSWSQHIISAAVVDPVALLVQDFLQLKVLFWIETMNLLGQRGRCNIMLGEAQKWIASSKGFANLAKDLRDAAAFAVYFSASPAAYSTPHLYLSALATFPQPTNLRATWRTNFGNIPTFTNAIRGGGSPLMSINVKSAVEAVAVSPDGFWVAVGLGNGRVQVWDLSTGEVLKTLKGHSNSVTSVAFSQDGTQIASGSDDCTVRVWDASNGEEQKILQGHNHWVSSVAFSQDGRWIVSGSGDETVRVWDALSGEVFKTLKGHTSTVTSVMFSQDGTRIVSGSDDQTVQVWDALSGELLKTLKGHSNTITSVAFSQDGICIVSGSYDQTVRVWNVSSGEHLMTLQGHSDRVESVAFSQDGLWIVSGSDDQTVRVWDLSTGEVLKTLQGHSDSVTSVAFTQDGTHIVSGSSNESVRVWDASSKVALKSLGGHTNWVMTVALAQDGMQIASGSKDRTVRIWDTSSREELRCLKGHSDTVSSVAFSKDGMCIVSGSHDKTVRVWDVSSGEVLKTLKGHSGNVNSVAFSQDSTRIVSGSDDCTLRVWDALSGEVLNILAGHSSYVTSVAFSQDGTQIVSGSYDDTVRMWDVMSGEEMKVLDGHTNSVTSVAFSQDGTRIVSGSQDKTLRVLDVSNREQLMTLEGHSNSVTSVIFSQDGMHIVSGSGDKTVRVWDASTGEVLKTLEGHSDWVRSVALSQDGTWIISGSDDRTVRVWDAKSGEVLNNVDDHSDRPNTLPPSEDVICTVSGSSSHSVQTGRLSTGTPIQYTCEKTLEDGLTGWLVASNNPSAYLMFVPLSENFLGDSIFALPHHAVSYVDFSKAKLGTDWAQCYTAVVKK